jgi:hypothetical protein
MELRRRLSCLQYEGDLVADLVRNLGFVAGRTFGNKATVRLHVEVVSDVALAAAFYWLADHHPAAVVIDFVGEQRPAEVCASTEAAIARLIELTQRHDFDDKIAERPCSLEQLSPRSPLRGLLEIWTRNQGRFNGPALINYAAQNLSSRYIVIRQGPFDRLLFDTLGDGLHVPDRGWLRSAVGSAVEDQPDAEYWQWVAQTYRSTLRSNYPALSDIDADIYWPLRGWVRRRYRRLRLPCTAADGVRFLFSANSDESGIALRAKVA